MIGIVVVGSAGYLVIETDPRPSVLDAVYQTVITVSTVGFTEVWKLSDHGRIWTMVIIAFGISTVSVAVSSLLSLFISGQLRISHEKRKMQSMIGQLRNHVVLCGYGRMGALVLGELRRRGLDVVVVESRREAEVELRDAHVPFVIGDATEEEVLLKAGIMHARCLICGLPHDADNVYITLSAHTLRPDLQIVSRAEHPTTEAKLKRAGAARVVCPQVVGANTIANVLTRPNVVDFFEIAHQGVQLEMDEYVIASKSPIAGKMLRESNLRQQNGAVVVAIKKADGKTLYSPSPDEKLMVGDTLIVVGPAGVANSLDQLDA